jgi:UDP-glucose:(heptosyl)LPS alpha-1,3-glucosyltransferase
VKLALVRQRYTPFGGAERFIERALRGLVDQGANVSVLAREWAGESDAGFTRVILNPLYPRWRGRSARDASFSAAVAAHLAQTPYDLVQSHERIPGCHIFRAGDGVHAAWLDRRAPALSPLRRLAQRWSPFHRRILAAERAMFAHPSLRAVICNSAMVRQEIIDYYGVAPEKLHVIRNGIDLEAFHPRLSDLHRGDMRARLGLPNDAPVFLCVGNGFERKGAGRAIEALSQLPAHGASAYLVIVGGDRHAARANKLASQLGVADRVVFAGQQKDVRPYYGMADFFVLPTLYDPFPNAALEAFACGLPVITSRGCGAAELIRDSYAGAVIDALDISALSTAMASLANVPQTVELRQAVRALALPLSLEKLTNELMALYRKIGGISAASV